jgi:putative DNA primase/helicase
MSGSASEIAARLGLRRTSGGRGWAGNCPACGYRDGLRVNEREGRALWFCASCGEHDRAALAEAVTGRRPSAQRQPASAPSDSASRREAALRLWNDARPIHGSPAQHYLATRGLVLPNGSALRFLPDAKHPSGARCMCMIALATDDAGRGQAVHRTYLAPGGIGKAKLDPPRATLGPIGGAVVRLCEPRDGAPLVIGEGIETSLSAGLLTGAPAWAALSAGNMVALHLPDAVREVWIASDHDAPGQRAAWAAADRLVAEGRAVRVLTPDTAAEDFNDIVQRRMVREAAHG